MPETTWRLYSLYQANLLKARYRDNSNNNDKKQSPKLTSNSQFHDNMASIFNKMKKHLSSQFAFS